MGIISPRWRGSGTSLVADLPSFPIQAFCTTSESCIRTREITTLFAPSVPHFRIENRMLEPRVALAIARGNVLSPVTWNDRT